MGTSLLNIQNYKVWNKGKVELIREKVATPLYLTVVAIEKGAFGSALTTVANFTYNCGQIIIVRYMKHYNCFKEDWFWNKIIAQSNTMLYTHMQNHNDDTIKTSRHSSLEKYTSHFIWKGS